MKDDLMIALKLTVICFAAVFILSAVNMITAPKIKANKQAEEQKALNFFFEGKEFSEKKSFKNNEKEYYYIATQNGKVAGYVATVIGSGYGGDMIIMVAFTDSLEVKNMKLLDNAETSGFGKRWENQKAMDMFVGSNTEEYPFPGSKSEVKKSFQSGPNGVSGATITFDAIVKAAKRGIKELENIK